MHFRLALLYRCVWLLACAGMARPALALLPLPLSANQRGTIYCLEKSSLSYDLYLPPAYNVNGRPLPILYTCYANGGGMVGDFQSVGSSLNIIVVGITGSKNGAPWDTEFQQFYAVTRDIRLRVLYDPTAELVGGFSGGAEVSYFFARFRAPHVAGVLTIGGWLGRTLFDYSTDRVQTNLFVARITGVSDTATLHYILPDSNYLASCGAVVQDWSISGGHSPDVPAATQTATLTWLLNQRQLAGVNDRTNAQNLATNWQARVKAGQSQSVLYECVSNLMNFPRSWYAYQAQLMLDQLATNTATFRGLTVTNLAQGDFASDLFYYYARSAANDGDLSRYRSALKALNGVTGTSGDRAGDVYNLLTQYSYPAPILNTSGAGPSGLSGLWISEDAPGLTYSPQMRSDLDHDVWLDMPLPAQDFNTIWSAAGLFDPTVPADFFRVSTVPTPGTSPPWPVN